MSVKEEYSYNNFTYFSEIDYSSEQIKLDIQRDVEIRTPNSLYKYYSLNKYSLDAFLNHYLFSSHPFLNNDKYDCAIELIDFSKVNLELFITKLHKEHNLLTEIEIRNLYSSDQKWRLERVFGDLMTIVTYMKFGIISLTEEDRDKLMWAYYAQNSGFAIKLNPLLLPKTFFGPYPINYVDKINQIDYTKYSPATWVLYQSNIKIRDWAHEKEWRYLTYNQKGRYHPFYRPKDISSRKMYYNQNAIEEIILGYDFVSPNDISFKAKTKDYSIVSFNSKKRGPYRKMKRLLLSRVVNLGIPCTQIVRKRDKYQLSKREVIIEKLSTNRYKLNFGEIIE